MPEKSGKSDKTGKYDKNGKNDKNDKDDKNEKGTQVQGKPKKVKSAACPFVCNLVPTNVPDPDTTRKVLHPKKDVFVLKVSKVGVNGYRRCKMELELVTPPGPQRKLPGRYDTREVQCDPECDCKCCCNAKKKNLT